MAGTPAAWSTLTMLERTSRDLDCIDPDLLRVLQADGRVQVHVDTLCSTTERPLHAQPVSNDRGFG
jgi:hypothetical protein